MAVITISRQYGSGGDEIAVRVCKILGYTYFDKKLLVKVATEVGAFDKDQIVDFSEDTYTMRNFMERLFGTRRVKVETWREDATGVRSSQIQSLDEAHGVALVRSTITGVYGRGNIVIVGRGGQAILREQPGVLHVRIEAPLGARALRIKEREKITMGEATALAESKDLAAQAYLSKFFDIEWSNPLLYHITLNTGRWEIEAAAQIIVNALSHLRVITQGLM